MEAILKVGCTRKSRTFEPSCLKLKSYMPLIIFASLRSMLKYVSIYLPYCKMYLYGLLEKGAWGGDEI